MDQPFSEHRYGTNLVLNPQSTAVLVVDMLNDFCTEGGLMVLPGAEVLYGPQQEVISAARRNGATVVYVNDGHRHGMRAEREFMKRTPHCWENSWGGAVIDQLAMVDGDLTVVKRRFSGFFQTDLDLTLHDMQIETVIVMGVVTNICVRSTVHDAFFLGYKVVVPSDCVAATGQREQDSSLYDIGTHFGWVSTSSAVVAGLSHGTPVNNLIEE